MDTGKGKLARGKILHRVAKTSQLSIREIVEKAGYKYSTFFAHIKQPDLPFEILAKYGKAMDHDFSNEFPEISDYVTEDKKNYSKELSYQELSADRDKWRQKYFETAEKYQRISEKYNKLLEEKLGFASEE